MSRVAVMGAGAWGTAFSLVLADAGHQVVLWARRAELAERITAEHRNPDYLPDVDLPPGVAATAVPGSALAGADAVVLALPSQRLRDSLARWRLPAAVPVVSLAKGIELGSNLRMSEVVSQVADVDPSRVAVLTGPNLAREIAERQPAAAVVAAPDEAVARRVQQLCHSAAFRPYSSTDVLGCELAGTTKNVIALAVGMAVGLGYGANAVAAVMTRGLAETARLGQAMGADPRTFAGLAGMGDLVATCSSPLSRNRTLGEQLGRGRTLAQASDASTGVAEGVKSCRAVAELARAHDVEMPIVTGVGRVVEGGWEPARALQELLARAPRPEVG